MKQSRTILAVAAALAVAMPVTTQAQDDPWIFSATYSTTFTDLDPSTSASNENAVLANVYEPLVWYQPASHGEDARLVPGLATEWTAAEDGLTWTFKLREGVLFHDGSAFDAEDVKFSIDRTLQIGGGLSYIWLPVESVEATGVHEVVFHLSEPAPVDLIASASYSSWIMSSTVGDKDSTWFNEGNAIGTGPYMIRDYEPGSRIVMERFEDYWGGFSDNSVDLAVFENIDDPVLREQRLRSGETDWVVDLEDDNLASLEEAPGVRIDRSPGFQNYAGHFNTRKEPLNDRSVRQALSYAFPYTDYIENALNGNGTLSRGPVPLSMEGHATGGIQYEFDLERARTLLAEAGYPEGGFELTATYTSGISHGAKATELYKAALAKIGITLEIRPMAWEAQWALATTDPGSAQDIFFMYWWPSYVTPYDFLASLYGSEDEPFFNLSYYSNSSYDDMIDTANLQLASDRQTGISGMSQAAEMLAEDAPSLFLFDQDSIHGIREDIQGYRDNPAYAHVIFLRELYR